jgi:monomeric sarcosine oxidase
MTDDADRSRVTRRTVLGGAAGGIAALLTVGPAVAETSAAAPPASADPQPERAPSTGMSNHWDSIVVGSGVFGAWTAWNLRRAGQRVLVLDAWGPAHARASSGGESRMTRTAYGKDEIYSRMAWESLADWKWLSERSGLPIFHPLGVLFFFPRREPYVDDTLAVHKRLNLPTDILDRTALKKRFPQASWDDIELGIFEPQLGALMARRAVQTLMREFVLAGGEYQLASVAPPSGKQLASITTAEGATLNAERFVFACGPWLPKVFPRLLGARIFPTRQEVFFFAPPAGDRRFEPGQLPGWADFNNGDIYYGFPDLEGRGFKVAHDRHGPAIDPDSGDRLLTPSALAEVRDYMARRFPALKGRPLVESRVCQYENSSNGDFLIDRHPEWSNVWLVGGGSGHGFKHGPAVGRLVADLVTGKRAATEPRFTLVSKGEVQNRAVH